MIANSQDATTQEDWDVPQLLSATSHSIRPDLALRALTDFTSSKDCMENAGRLKGEDAAKLVDVFDQVCHAGLRDSLTRLTTTMTTRPSDPAI